MSHSYMILWLARDLVSQAHSYQVCEAGRGMPPAAEALASP